MKAWFHIDSALAPFFLSKAHRTVAAGASVAVWVMRVPLAGPPIRGPEPPQGRESGPNSGVRLCFHIENRIRGGFSLVIGLTFLHQLAKGRERPTERVVASLEQRQFVER